MTIEWTDPDYAKVYQSGSKRNIVVGYADLMIENIIINSLCKPGSRSIVCYPTKAGVRERFSKLRRRLDAYSAPDPVITRDISAPYSEIGLSNTSRIRGFGFNSGGLCGQDADSIYIHQTEDIEYKQVVGAILPMLQTSPDTEITFFFEGKDSKNWDMLNGNEYYSTHDFLVKADAGMLTNPFTGRKSWL